MHNIQYFNTSIVAHFSLLKSLVIGRYFCGCKILFLSIILSFCPFYQSTNVNSSVLVEKNKTNKYNFLLVLLVLYQKSNDKQEPHF